MKPVSIRSMFLGLEVGQSFDVELLGTNTPTIRYYASDLGMTMGRKFRTHVNRERGVISVIREA